MARRPNANPEVLGGTSIGQVADLGGLLTQIIAGRGDAPVPVAIDPAATPLARTDGRVDPEPVAACSATWGSRS